MLVTYRRSGGPKPRSEEQLEVSETGEATARRVVAAGRAGWFASRLDDAELASLRKTVAAVAGVTVDLEAPGRPPYQIEDIETAGGSLSVHPAQKLPRPVTTLRNRLRGEYEELAENPVAGLELAVDASGSTVSVRAIGAAPCEVDWSAAAATYDLYDARQAWVSSGEVELTLNGGRQELAPGWEQHAPITGIAFSPEKTLQVRLAFSMKFDDGRWRDCQVTVVAGKGW